MTVGHLSYAKLCALPGLIAEGLDAGTIAQRFGVSAQTVRAHCRRLGCLTSGQQAEEERRVSRPPNPPGERNLPPDWSGRDTAVIPPPVALPPDREPCGRCAQRGDLPCRHRPWITAPPPPAPEPHLTLAQRIHAEAQAIVARRALARVQGIRADLTTGAEA